MTNWRRPSMTARTRSTTISPRIRRSRNPASRRPRSITRCTTCGQMRPSAVETTRSTAAKTRFHLYGPTYCSSRRYIESDGRFPSPRPPGPHMNMCIPPGPPIPIICLSLEHVRRREVSRSSPPEPDLAVRLDADRVRRKAAHLLRCGDQPLREQQWDPRRVLLDELRDLLVELGPLARVSLVARAAQELAHDIARPCAPVREERVGIRALAARVSDPEREPVSAGIGAVRRRVLGAQRHDESYLREVRGDAFRDALWIRVLRAPRRRIPELGGEAARDTPVREQALRTRGVEAVELEHAVVVTEHSRREQLRRGPAHAAVERRRQKRPVDGHRDGAADLDLVERRRGGDAEVAYVQRGSRQQLQIRIGLHRR